MKTIAALALITALTMSGVQARPSNVYICITDKYTMVAPGDRYETIDFSVMEGQEIRFVFQESQPTFIAISKPEGGEMVTTKFAIDH